MSGPSSNAAAHLPRWLDGRRIRDLDPADRDRRTEQLLHEAAALRGARKQELLDQVVLLNGPVAEAIAGRYRARGIDSDDLVQVAYLGLIKASQGYRKGEGPGFLAYAAPTISGEIKRHFRDHGWMVRPPRRLQELRSAAMITSADLLQRHGRSPTEAELAEHLGVEVEELSEAELADGCFSALSLDAPGPSDGGAALVDLLVDDVDTFDHVENMAMLRPALASLSERDRRILLLRFVRGRTQEEIGREIGVSQMQVSRLLTRILTALRTELTERDDSDECEARPA